MDHPFHTKTKRPDTGLSSPLGRPYVPVSGSPLRDKELLTDKCKQFISPSRYNEPKRFSPLLAMNSNPQKKKKMKRKNVDHADDAAREEMFPEITYGTKLVRRPFHFPMRHIHESNSLLLRARKGFSFMTEVVDEVDLEALLPPPKLYKTSGWSRVRKAAFVGVALSRMKPSVKKKSSVPTISVTPERRGSDDLGFRRRDSGTMNPESLALLHAKGKKYLAEGRRQSGPPSSDHFKEILRRQSLLNESSEDEIKTSREAPELIAKWSSRFKKVVEEAEKKGIRAPSREGSGKSSRFFMTETHDTDELKPSKGETKKKGQHDSKHHLPVLDLPSVSLFDTFPTSDMLSKEIHLRRSMSMYEMHHAAHKAMKVEELKSRLEERSEWRDLSIRSVTLLATLSRMAERHGKKYMMARTEDRTRISLWEKAMRLEHRMMKKFELICSSWYRMLEMLEVSREPANARSLRVAELVREELVKENMPGEEVLKAVMQRISEELQFGEPEMRMISLARKVFRVTDTAFLDMCMERKWKIPKEILHRLREKRSSKKKEI
eukprot:TRINITY_DN7542_c0_g1_i1.p1 TRINITY_DN7542_c0_g1~~TRINITY_DN7542_c0_g1_i1.p1  ORF type:complete len:549 (-),score=152.85 TRINITY_DN7542_c0_g1_i1:125-1771(-)